MSLSSAHWCLKGSSRVEWQLPFLLSAFYAGGFVVGRLPELSLLMIIAVGPIPLNIPH